MYERILLVEKNSPWLACREESFFYAKIKGLDFIVYRKLLLNTFELESDKITDWIREVSWIWRQETNQWQSRIQLSWRLYVLLFVKYLEQSLVHSELGKN